MKILAFTKYDREAASTRVRVLQYLPELAAAGITVEHRPLLGKDHVRSLAGTGRRSLTKVAGSYLSRLADVIRRPRADLIWIYAELLPWLPGGFERLVHRHRIPVVYDLDDAFFVPYDDHRSPLVRKLLKGKLEPLIRGAAAVTCGNDYLRDYAARLNPRALVLPTVVDTDSYVPAPAREGPPVIGWIGSPTTWCNVQPLLPLLRRLQERHGFRLRMVGAGRAAERDGFAGLELVPWAEEREVAEVQGFDIGIMPLLDRPFQRGKSGYKLIQYMACGVPVVASPVGVNAGIVRPGEQGFLAGTEPEWEEALLTLLGDPQLRALMGAAGRALAVERYSLASQAPRLIALFRELGTPR